MPCDSDLHTKPFLACRLPIRDLMQVPPEIESSIRMSRSKAFHPAHEPFRENTSIQLQDSHVTGPFSFLNPTRAHFQHAALQLSSKTTSDKSKVEPEKDEPFAPEIEFKWRSRDNRKGRHALVVQPSAAHTHTYITPAPTHTWSELRKGLWRMVIQYPYWDVSYLVATIFTLGSCVWVINAFFAYLPLARPGTEFKNEVLYAGGITAFIGATIFEIGSVLLMFEAVNENRSGCFGWALERLIEGKEGHEGRTIRVRPSKGQCSHHHTNKKNLVGKSDGKSKSWGD